jgi:hypothetical protein
VEAQAGTLERWSTRWEDGAFRYKRIEDALTRSPPRERAIPARTGRRPPSRSACQARLGCDAHQRIAEEMSRFL